MTVVHYKFMKKKNIWQFTSLPFYTEQAHSTSPEIRIRFEAAG